MTKDNKPRADNDALFDGMLEASGVDMPDQERENLRKAHSALMVLAERARPKQKDRAWEVRMAPFHTPKPAKRDGGA